MVTQYEFKLQARPRGFHLITREILSHVPELPEYGLFNVFIKHTSAALSINENADPTVREDFETYYNAIVDEDMPGLKHTLEGPDDMPAHIKASITGAHVSIPITKHGLNLGIWQGIYLCEFRNYGGARTIVVSIIH